MNPSLEIANALVASGNDVLNIPNNILYVLKAFKLFFFQYKSIPRN